MESVVIDRGSADKIAIEWLEAWNQHRPDLVVVHFAEDVVVSSPVADRLRPGSGGVLHGKPEVLAYYVDGLAALPDLKFTLVETLIGVDQITIVYRNQSDVLVAETLTMGNGNAVTAVSVAYGTA
jgi:hypothetical protein